MATGGTCRLCYSAQNQVSSSTQEQPPRNDIPYNNTSNRLQQQRRRLRRSSQQDHRPTPQPTVVMIQYKNDRPEDAQQHADGIILCKWLPTSLPLHPLLYKPGDNNKIKEKDKGGTYCLEFDETVVIFPNEMLGRNSTNNTNNTSTMQNTIMDDLLRFSSLEENQPICGAVDGNSCLRQSWSLGNDDDRETNNNVAKQRRLNIQTDPDQLQPFTQRGLALPLWSVPIRPLQSLIISVDGWDDDATHSKSHSGTNSKSSKDRMFILMQAFWKRQLVGKVIAFDDQWRTKIKLATDDTNGEELQDSNAVYAVVESCTPLRFATMPPTYTSPQRTKDTTKGILLSLPKQFYMVLPSTYITIQPSTTAQTSTNASDGASTFKGSRIPPPPSPAASLLMDTLDCIRSRGAEDGNDVPRSFLLSGPPGVGKTFSVSWAATAHPDTILCSIRGSELLQGNKNARNNNIPAARALELEFLKLVHGISLRERETTQNNDSTTAVAGLVFLDECDALVSVEPIAAMLAYLLDRVSSSSLDQTNSVDEDRYWKRIVVVGATNRIDSIPSYLRRAGRFDRELAISPPLSEKRAELLSSLLKNLQTNEITKDKTPLFTLPSPDEIQEIAELCVGYVAADLSALVRKAWLLFLQEGTTDNSSSGITTWHLETARSIVGASALRDAALAAPPKITWDEIAGDPGGAKTALRQAIEWPRTKAREFALLGLQPCRGILLHGPPGCAKTTLARAAAGSSGVAFFSLSPSQVYASSYVGEAERVVRQAFHLARSTAPCILFFDEIDSIFGNGGGNEGGGGSLGGSGRGSSAEARVLSTFLNEMDGVDIAGTGTDGVLVLGATNRPWTLDPALLRPGRLGDKIIFLPPPDQEARRSIFEKQFHLSSVHTNDDERKDEMAWDIDPSILVELSDGMTGAEIVGACQEAKIQWMREVVLNIKGDDETKNNEDGFQQQDCIVNALMSIKPLLSNPDALEEFRVFENRDKKTIHR